MPEPRSFLVTQFTSLALGCSPLLFLVVMLGLLALSLWIGRHAWVSLRILSGSRTVPVTDLRTAPAGLVKVQGIALPPPAKPGWNESSIVWSERVEKSSLSSQITSSRTVGQIRIQTTTGVCAMDVEKAKVVPTTGEMKGEFLNQEGWKSSGEIRRGDPVFALARIESRARSGDSPDTPGWELCPAQGVLLLSGAPERQVQVQFGIWLLLQGTVTLVLAGTLLWGSWTHLSSYPPGGIGSLGTFFGTLARTPLQSNPGISHPDWEVHRD